MTALDLMHIARPYANAAFQVALSRGQLAEWGKFLAALALISQNEDAYRLLEDPRFTREKKSEWLADLCQKLKVLDEQQKAFLLFIAMHRRLAILSILSELFQEYHREHEKRVHITVTTTSPLSTAQQEQLSQALQKRYQREVSLEMESDPLLIGGIIINAGDEIIDGSLRGQIQRLRAKLANPYQ